MRLWQKRNINIMISWLDKMRNSENDNDNVWSSENDDNDELDQYSLSDDEEDLRKVALPSSIRDCWELLTSKEKPDKTTLIRNNPSDLKDVSIGFCRTLLHLNNEYS